MIGANVVNVQSTAIMMRIVFCGFEKNVRSLFRLIARLSALIVTVFCILTSQKAKGAPRDTFEPSKIT